MMHVSHIINQLLFTTGVSLALFEVQLKNYPRPTTSDLFVGERESHIFHERRQDDSDREFCERLMIQENCAYSGEFKGGFDKVKPLKTLKDAPRNLLDREFSQTI